MLYLQLGIICHRKVPGNCTAVWYGTVPLCLRKVVQHLCAYMDTTWLH